MLEIDVKQENNNLVNKENKFGRFANIAVHIWDIYGQFLLVNIGKNLPILTIYFHSIYLLILVLL